MSRTYLLSVIVHKNGPFLNFITRVHDDTQKAIHTLHYSIIYLELEWSLEFCHG